MNWKDHIDELKRNEKPFGLLSEELREAMGEAYTAGANIDYYTGEDTWTRTDLPVWVGTTVYRISPDWQPEKDEVERCEVHVENRELVYCRDGQLPMVLTDALNDPEFIAYEDKDGVYFEEPRSFIGKGVRPADTPADIPSAVLFRRARGER
jgi:hypothetical protein